MRKGILLVAGLLALIAASLLWQSMLVRQAADACREESNKEVAALHQTLKALSDRLEQLEAGQGQTNVFLQRTVGKDIPVKVPAEVLKKLDALEGQVRGKAQWPPARKEAEHFQQELAALIGALPAWTEQALLPRLVPLRWSSSALLQVRAAAPGSPGELEKQKEDVEELLENAPDGVATELKSALGEVLKSCISGLARIRHEEAVRQAEAAIASAKKEEAALSAAWSALGSLGSKEPKVKELRERLALQIRDLHLAGRVSLVEGTFKRVAEAMKEERLRQGGLARVHDAASALLLDLEVETPRPAAEIRRVSLLLQACEAEQLRLARRQQERSAHSLRDYQRWALEQIDAFDGPGGWNYDLTLPWVQAQLSRLKNPSEETSWAVFRLYPATKAVIAEKLGVDLSEVKGSKLSPEQQQSIYDAAYARVGWNKSIDQELAYLITARPRRTTCCRSTRTCSTLPSRGSTSGRSRRPGASWRAAPTSSSWPSSRRSS